MRTLTISQAASRFFRLLRVSRQWPNPSSRGVALVLVLGMLALVSILIIAFLQGVRTDLSSSATYEKSTSTRLLADTALNVVIGQLQEATQRPGEAWVSQPGLIRTFDNSGNPVSAYKLYSNDQMRVDGAFDPSAGTDLPSVADVTARPDEFVDMNAPIKTTLLNASGTPSDHWLFPIIDPRAQGEVEGFSFDSAWGNDASTGGNPSLAMPVKWLYLLKDGTVAPGISATGGGVTIANETKANPAVARIAFWTDDETCKVNINTAAAGTPWDTPVCNTYPNKASLLISNLKTRPSSWPNKIFEADYAQFQPALNEYQRYPGHPATTSLEPILSKAIAKKLGGSPTRAQILEVLYNIAPRYDGGNSSSLAGTQSVLDNNRPPLRPGAERLYASIDELLFTPALSGDTRTVSPLEVTETARRQIIERAKFFATATSKAPEVNLYNKPRIVAWPVHVTDDPQYRSAYDRLIAFCGTVGTSKKPYYFTRQNPLSKTVDWSTRNQEIYRYLQSITDLAIPGFGGSFKSKLGIDRDQVLTEIFDYIRCLNLQDVSVAKSYTGTSDKLRGMVVPIEPAGAGAGTKGFGRIATISEVGVVVVGGAKDLVKKTTKIRVMLYPEVFCPMVGFSAMAVNQKLTFTGLKAADGLRVNGTLLPFPNDQVVMYQDTIVKMGDYLGQSRVGGYMGIAPFIYSPNPANPNNNTPIYPPICTDFEVPGLYNSDPATAGYITINKGSKIRFKMEAPYTGSPEIVQNFEMEFDRDIVLPIPYTFSATSLGTRVSYGSTYNYYQAVWKGNDDSVPAISTTDSVVSLVPANNLPAGKNIQGDLRLIAAASSKENPGQYFSAHPLATATKGSARSFHNLRPNYCGPVNGHSGSGKLVNGIVNYDTPVHDYSWSTMPDLAPDIVGVENYLKQPGDWDNGPGIQSDGPYLNKADEGTTTASSIPYVGYGYTSQEVATISPTIFSPNRQMPSPVMFGSLPTGIKRVRPWQTLLFRPARSYLPGGINHPGSTATGPADHLLLDLFWMPVVEPYAISEPFSTAGKINMNYQIAPFNYITRDTGLRAVFSGAVITALNPSLPSSDDSTRLLVNRYKMGNSNATATKADSGMPDVSVRFGINAAATLKFFEDRFKNSDPSKRRPFISASEICDIPLVPDRNDNGTTFATASDDVSSLESKLSTFWGDHKLTGDNSLERPYAHLYPRLTTKSNTYTVHVRVQQLATTSASAEAGKFNSTRDKVAGEFRGSFVIERYLDPNSDSLVKDAGAGSFIPVSDDTDPSAVLGPYKFRVITSKQISQ